MAITLTRPAAADQVVTIPANKEELEVILSFPLADAIIERDGDNLVVFFDGGEKIVVENFYTEYTGDAIPDFVVDDATIDGKEFFKSLGDETLMPAAGGESASQDGGRFYDDSAAALARGVDALGKVAGGSEYGRFGDLDPGQVTGTPRAAASEVQSEVVAPVPPTVTATITAVNTVESTAPGRFGRMSLSDSPQGEATVRFDIHLSNPPEGAATVTVRVGETDYEVEIDSDGNGVLYVPNPNADDVYNDASTLTATIIAINGGNYEVTDVTDANATAQIVDTINTVTATITPVHTVEGTANVQFNIQLSNPPQGEATVTVRVGTTDTPFPSTRTARVFSKFRIPMPTTCTKTLRH